jgi:hypothetical protein
MIRVALVLARVSADGLYPGWVFLPFRKALIFALASAVCVVPNLAALIFARASGVCLRPSMVFWPKRFWAALMFARASVDLVCPRVDLLPLFAAPIFARVSGDNLCPFRAALTFAFHSGGRVRPL